MSKLYYESELAHHGIKGMKWGRRRFQNSDGSLTPAGRSRYSDVMTKAGTAMAKSKVGQAGVKAGKAIVKQNQARITKKNAKKDFTEDSYNENKGKMGKVYDKVTGAHKYGGDLKYAMASKSEREARARKYEADQAAYKQSDEYKTKVEKRKKALKIGAAVAGTALVAYGGYKLSKAIKEENFNVQKRKGMEEAERIMKDNFESYTMGKNPDGSYFFTSTKNGKDFFTQNNLNEMQIKNYGRVSKLSNRKTQREAWKAFDDRIEKGRTDSLAKATKNVVTDRFEQAKANRIKIQETKEATRKMTENLSKLRGSGISTFANGERHVSYDVDGELKVIKGLTEAQANKLLEEIRQGIFPS